MSEKGIWEAGCPEHTRGRRDTCDGHWPFSHDISDSTRMAYIKQKSADEIKKACCPTYCYGFLKFKKLTCPAGYTGRDKWDGHNPFGNEWDTKTDKEITDECCQKQNQCSVKLSEKGLKCDEYGRTPGGEYTHGNPGCNTVFVLRE